ncbi:acyl-CoA carboxylase epsilon subunit [Streptomyces sp. NPDC088116]|uniref:acyl-CoA carboxylase epsilon subunit n=1 Tax=Streptomyces sp. NPDC088116 TaxID=3365825 RepID=UPI003812CA49
MINVVRGNPTREELAAALAVVQARTAAVEEEDSPSGPAGLPAQWSAPARIARHRVPRPGPGAWARTYWPG